MPKNPKTIAVVTGTRAEFGLLTSVMHAIRAHRDLRLKTVVTGTHLTTGTSKDIRNAGFAIDARVPMQRAGQSGRGADVQALARGVAGLGKAFDRLQADGVLILGDRIEVLAAATAASVGGRHVIHLHGGDRAEGVADEAMRHATSKLAHLHFVGCAASGRRLVRMGEDPRFVFNHGSPAIAPGSFPRATDPGSLPRTPKNLRRATGPGPDLDPAPELIVMLHPIGDTDAREARRMRAVLAATRGHTRLILAPNHDPGHAGIRQVLKDHETCSHLPREQFLARLAGARAIVGNSSAGLIEAAALKTPCVNIGPRQAGRTKPRHVIDCGDTQADIRAAIRQALSLNLSRLRHPYGDGHTGQKIADTLATIHLTQIPLRKRNTY